MIGKPMDAPAPMLAKLNGEVVKPNAFNPAAFVTAAHGFLRSARGAPSFAPAMICGLPSIRGSVANTVCAAAER